MTVLLVSNRSYTSYLRQGIRCSVSVGKQALRQLLRLRCASVTGLALPSSPSLRCSVSSPGYAALRLSCPPQLHRATATCRRRQPLAFITPALRSGSVIRCQGPLLQSASFLGLLLQRCLPHGGWWRRSAILHSLRSSAWPTLTLRPGLLSCSLILAALPTYSRNNHHPSPNLPQPPEQSFSQLMNYGGFGLQKKT